MQTMMLALHPRWPKPSMDGTAPGAIVHDSTKTRKAQPKVSNMLLHCRIVEWPMSLLIASCSSSFVLHEIKLARSHCIRLLSLDAGTPFVCR
jgi:hypothetical protein